MSTVRGDSERRPRSLRRELVGLGLGAVSAAIGLLLASWIVPSYHPRGIAHLLVTGALVCVAGALLRVLLVRMAIRTGWLGAVLLGLGGQTLAVWLVLFAPSDDLDWDTFWWAFLAAWIVAAVSTLVLWLATAGTDEAVTAPLLRKARRRRTSVPDPDVPGVVFVQADGVPFPVLQWCMRAGNLPTIGRWLREGTHRMAEWRPSLPATTPASQMGILHGTIEGIPAFRWYDRAEDRVYVANKAKDAAVIESKHSDGRGLLADDGVSVSNLFTGDAPVAVATMSAIDRTRETHYARATISEFMGRPAGFARSLSRTVAEVVRERFQAAKGRRRDIRPRVHRGWDFALERAALSGVMRDLNTTLVADAMLSGHRAIYVDYVDYDAVAHHAGLLQPESLSALEGIDAVLAQLEHLTAYCPRPYHVVVLSDHGQAQGATFADRYGEDLAALVTRLAEARAKGATDNEEGSGALTSMAASAGGDDSMTGRAFDRVSRLGPTADEPEPAPGGAPANGAREFLVFGSGNLGLVYLTGRRERATLEELWDRFPALVPGLAKHPGVGFVVVDSVADGLVALGADGEHRLQDGRVRGVDPLARFGASTPEFVRRAASMPEAPDIYVNSLVDDLDEVAAFEGLVGCHGGLGGWQDRAMVVHPADFHLPDDMVVGADALHRVLVQWLEQLGHRTDLPARSQP